jgi:hypothetical protein
LENKASHAILTECPQTRYFTFDKDQPISIRGQMQTTPHKRTSPDQAGDNITLGKSRDLVAQLDDFSHKVASQDDPVAKGIAVKGLDCR